MLTVSEDEDDLFGAIKAGAQGSPSQGPRERATCVACSTRSRAAKPRSRPRPPRGSWPSSPSGAPSAPDAGPLDRTRDRRAGARHGWLAQQGDRRPAGDQREHRQVPPCETSSTSSTRGVERRSPPSRCVRGSVSSRSPERPPERVAPCAAGRGRPAPRHLPGREPDVLPDRMSWPNASPRRWGLHERRGRSGLPHQHRPWELHQLRCLHGCRRVRALDMSRPGSAGRRGRRWRRAAVSLDDGVPGPGRRVHRL